MATHVLEREADTETVDLNDLQSVVSTCKMTRWRIVGALLLTDSVALIAGLFIASGLIYGFFDFERLATIVTVSLPLVLLLALNNGSYSVRIGSDEAASVYRALGALVVCGITLLTLASLLKVGASFSRAQLLVGLGLSGVFIAMARIAFAWLICQASTLRLYAELHIYDGLPLPQSTDVMSISAGDWNLAHDRGDSLAVKRLGTVARGMDSVIVHCRPEDRANWALALRTLDVATEIVTPEIGELMPLSIVWRNGTANVLINSGQLPWNQRLIKRLFDLCMVAVLIPGMLIIFSITALAIKLDTRGPVFFRQERIGIGNRPFRIWKFRSMTVSGQDDQASCLTTRNDARVTRVGAFIRRTSIDELPQLLNVLAGDMSIVGPRPHAMGAKAGDRLYWEVDQAYWQRHVVKPGITGLAQVRGFRGNTFREVHLRNRLEADLEYVARWSLLLDMKIIAGTMGVLQHENAF